MALGVAGWCCDSAVGRLDALGESGKVSLGAFVSDRLKVLGVYIGCRVTVGSVWVVGS